MIGKMKKIALFFLVLLVFLGCRQNKDNKENSETTISPSINSFEHQERIYDTVIVGGGMAGLSAAYHLKNVLGENAKILLLEKENRLGGKILTKTFKNDIYELGASFDYGNTYAPKGFEPSELVKLNKNYGYFFNGSLYSAKSISELLKKVNPADEHFFDEYNKDYDINKLFNSVSNNVKKVIESSFKVIHFGNFNDYVDERKKDAFKTYNLDFRVKGNYEFLDSYAKILKGNYILSAEAESIEHKDSLIWIQYKKNNKTSILKAKSVIVATPATVAHKIIKNMNEESEKFVKSVKYTKTMIIVFITNRHDPIDFSYILTPDKSFNNVNTFYSADKKRNIFSIYFADSFIISHPDWNNDDYIKAAYKDFQSMNLVDLDKDLLHTDSFFWKEEGTVISDETYKNFSVDAINPLPGVFLAGDYTFWNKYKIPYGIPPAYFSGKTAAQKVVNYLKK